MLLQNTYTRRQIYNNQLKTMHKSEKCVGVAEILLMLGSKQTHQAAHQRHISTRHQNKEQLLTTKLSVSFLLIKIYIR